MPSRKEMGFSCFFMTSRAVRHAALPQFSNPLTGDLAYLLMQDDRLLVTQMDGQPSSSNLVLVENFR